ncbi:MAG: NYN domain-containing protein [Patescibacteria group bacterium]
MKKISQRSPSKSKAKRPKIYAFIDSQNLNLGTSKNLYNKNKRQIYSGWKLDFQKFFIYLRDKFRVSKAFLFIGYIEDNQKLYDELKKIGYQLIYKPTTKDALGKPKGNIDAELVLHAAAIEFNHYHQAVIVSGDGDFRCLYEFLIGKKKLLRIIIPNIHAQSSLLRGFQKYKTFLEYEKEKLKHKK